MILSNLPEWFAPDPNEPIENGFIQYGPGKGLIKKVFEAKDASQNLVAKIATIDKSKGKIILIQPSEKSLYLSGLRERGVVGYLYLFAHATPFHIQGLDKGFKVGNVIRNSGIWNGEPIIIDACRAGQVSNGIASELAQNLQTYVVAPTTITWNYPLGGSAVGQGAFEALPGVLARLRIPNFFNPGSWGIWGPDGAPVATARTSPRDIGGTVDGRKALESLRQQP